MFSHALSTHSTANEIDFFAAVDERHPADVTGAAMTDTLEFNSSCYYRYIGLNLDMLSDEEHLGRLPDIKKKDIINTFLRAAILAVPAARKNSMFGQNPPAYVFGLRRQGQPLSLVNAFEKPVRSSQGYVENSINALNRHWEQLSTTYCLRDQVQAEASIPQSNLDDFIVQLT